MGGGCGGGGGFVLCCTVVLFYDYYLCVLFAVVLFYQYILHQSKLMMCLGIPAIFEVGAKRGDRSNKVVVVMIVLNT
jgi:hypothetical protein